MRITCGGYFEGIPAGLDALAGKMDDIRAGEIERPELEITSIGGGGDAFHLGALFLEVEGTFAGWFITKWIGGMGGESLAFRRVRPEPGTSEVLYCGGPLGIRNQAIIPTDEALSLFSRLIRGEAPAEYDLVDLGDVILL